MYQAVGGGVCDKTRGSHGHGPTLAPSSPSSGLILCKSFIAVLAEALRVGKTNPYLH